MAFEGLTERLQKADDQLTAQGEDFGKRSSSNHA